MRKNVLFVINSLTGGGAERVMATLLRHSEAWRHSHKLSLALLDDTPAAYSLPDWLPVTQLDTRGGLLASILQLRALVRRSPPDVVLSFLTRANVSTCLALAGTGTPFVLSERVNTSAHLPRGLSGMVSRALVRLTYPRARHVIAVSQGVADDLTSAFGVREERVSILSNPVDEALICERAQDWTVPVPDGPYVAAMGRLVPNKNFGLLVDAFARSGIAGRLVIMGEGPERAALVRKIADLGLADRVSLPGFLENPFPVIARAQCYVLPSNAEGFPNGLVEAMALGVPVISTNCRSGPSEILAERPRTPIGGLECAAHGLLVPCDDRAALAEALLVYQDEARRLHFARAAEARARDFTVAASVARYWAVIEGAMERGGPATAGEGRLRRLQAAP